MTAARTLIVALLALGVAAAPAGAAKKKKVPLTTAQSKVVAHFGKTHEAGTYRATCSRAKKGSATCVLVRTAGSGPACAKGTVKRKKGGRIVATSKALTDCGGVAGAPSGEAAPAPAGAPQPPVDVPAPAPAAPVVEQLSGTFVCLTGIIAQVRPAGPTSIAPIEVPEVGLEPPLKFTLFPDGTYANITFGSAYANDPLWKGTYTVDGERVKLVTTGGATLLSYDLLRRTDTAGTQYLIEDAPANDAYRANVCRRIA